MCFNHPATKLFTCITCREVWNGSILQRMAIAGPGLLSGNIKQMASLTWCCRTALSPEAEPRNKRKTKEKRTGWLGFPGSVVSTNRTAKLLITVHPWTSQGCFSHLNFFAPFISHLCTQQCAIWNQYDHWLVPSHRVGFGRLRYFPAVNREEAVGSLSRCGSQLV